MFRAACVASFVLMVVALWTPEARAQEARPDIEGAEGTGVTETSEVSVVDAETIDYVPFGIAGLAVFGASWGATIVVAATTASGNKRRAAGHAVVPVGGPFIMLSERSHADDLEGVLGGLGALQGLGLAAALLGFTLESKVITDKSAAWVAPTVSPGGLGLHGAF